MPRARRRGEHERGGNKLREELAVRLRDAAARVEAARAERQPHDYDELHQPHWAREWRRPVAGPNRDRRSQRMQVPHGHHGMMMMGQQQQQRHGYQADDDGYWAEYLRRHEDEDNVYGSSHHGYYPR